MSLWDRLRVKPRHLWTDEEKEAHCERYAEGFVRTWKEDWGVIAAKVVEQTDLNLDQALTALAWVHRTGSIKKDDEARQEHRHHVLEVRAINRETAICNEKSRETNEHLDSVLVRVEMMLDRLER